MQRRLLILSTLLCASLSVPLSLTPCPESCACTSTSKGVENLDLQCSSLNFLEKLLPKQVKTIVNLEVKNRNLTSLNPKLKKLRNLKKVNFSHNKLGTMPELQQLHKLTYLNLKNNYLKHLTGASLPLHLKHLEVSHNYINSIPKILKHLPDLEEVNLADNPIVCSCDTISEYKVLLNSGVVFIKAVLCHSPEKLKGRSIDSVSCSDLKIDILDQMQGDEPFDGSGDEPPSPLDNTSIIYTDHKNYTGLEDEELIPESPMKSNEEEEEEEGWDENEDVGSGDNSQDISNELVDLKACNFNCSTISLDFEPEINATKDPDIYNEMGKVFKDIFPFGEGEYSSSTTDYPEEPMIVKENVDKVERNRAFIPVQKENIENAPTDADSNLLGDTEKSAFNSNVIIVIVLILIMVCLIIFSIVRRRKARNKTAEPTEQEMKTLNAKPANGNSTAPEKVPLMNGQNGSMNGKPVEEPVQVRRNEEVDSKETPEDDVILRVKNMEEENLLPETHRVTIQAKELSTPKTPMLVNRERNDDGTYVIR